MLFNFYFSQLLKESYIACGELDPINRRLSSSERPEVIVQIVVLAKDDQIKEILAQSGFNTKTMHEVTNIEIHSARVLSHLYTFLGKHFFIARIFTHFYKMSLNFNNYGRNLIVIFKIPSCFNLSFSGNLILNYICIR